MARDTGHRLARRLHAELRGEHPADPGGGVGGLARNAEAQNAAARPRASSASTGTSRGWRTDTRPLGVTGTLGALLVLALLIWGVWAGIRNFTGANLEDRCEELADLANQGQTDPETGEDALSRYIETCSNLDDPPDNRP